MPDGPDEYLPGLEPDEPAVEESTDTTPEAQEPSEVRTSGDAGEDYSSRWHQDSYDVHPEEYEFPFRVDDLEERDDLDPIDLAAAGLPRRVNKDGVPYEMVPPEDHHSWSLIRRTRATLRKHLTSEEEQEARRLRMWWAIFGMLGAVAALGVIGFLFRENPPDTQTLDAIVPAFEEAPVEGPEAPLTGSELAGAEELLIDTSEALTAYFECPEGFQMDVTGRWMSGRDGEQREPDTETEIDRGGNSICNRWRVHSHEFTMIVEGDGEALSMADNTSYQVTFIVNNKWPENEFYDDTGFLVRVQWQRQAQAFAGQVLNADQFNPQPIDGATIDIEWLDQSTLQVIVDIPGNQVDVTEVRTEVNVYITDEDGGFVYERSDVAIWNAET